MNEGIERLVEGKAKRTGLIPSINFREQPVLSDIIRRMSLLHPILERATQEQLYDMALYTSKCVYRLTYDLPTNPEIAANEKGHIMGKLHEGLKTRIGQLKTKEEKRKETNLPQRVINLLLEEFVRQAYLAEYLATEGSGIGAPGSASSSKLPFPTFEAYSARRESSENRMKYHGLGEILEGLGLAKTDESQNFGQGKNGTNRRYSQLKVAELLDDRR